MKPSLDPTTLPSLQQAHQNRSQLTATHSTYQAQNQGMSITLKTEEGDTITISQQSSSSQYRKESLAADSYRLVDQSLSVNAMTLSVKGDLNQQELADLTALFGDLTAIAADFFTGNMDDAVAGALNIGDMGTISSLDATFTRSSILSGYLQVPHPLPSLGPDTAGLLAQDGFPAATDRPDRAAQPDAVAVLAAQWQQFVDSIGQHRPTSSVPEAKRTSPASPTETAQAMFERAKTTLANTPRLSPLLPSIANMAVTRAAGRYFPNESASLMAKSTARAFNSLFSDWTI